MATGNQESYVSPGGNSEQRYVVLEINLRPGEFDRFFRSRQRLEAKGRLSSSPYSYSLNSEQVTVSFSIIQPVIQKDKKSWRPSASGYNEYRIHAEINGVSIQLSLHVNFILGRAYVELPT